MLSLIWRPLSLSFTQRTLTACNLISPHALTQIALTSFSSLTHSFLVSSFHGGEEKEQVSIWKSLFLCLGPSFSVSLSCRQNWKSLFFLHTSTIGLISRKDWHIVCQSDYATAWKTRNDPSFIVRVKLIATIFFIREMRALFSFVSVVSRSIFPWFWGVPHWILPGTVPTEAGYSPHGQVNGWTHNGCYS